jgi:hypothetical protein
VLTSFLCDGGVEFPNVGLVLDVLASLPWGRRERVDSLQQRVFIVVDRDSSLRSHCPDVLRESDMFKRKRDCEMKRSPVFDSNKELSVLELRLQP